MAYDAKCTCFMTGIRVTGKANSIPVQGSRLLAWFNFNDTMNK